MSVLSKQSRKIRLKLWKWLKQQLKQETISYFEQSDDWLNRQSGISMNLVRVRY